jgi:DNA transposition AAA+ family ATPase
MAATRKDAARALASPPPPYQKVRDAAGDYIARADMTFTELAERVGYGTSTLNLWMQGRYSRVAADDTYIRAAIWEFIQQHPIEPKTALRGRLFETENYRHIAQYFNRAIELGEIVLLYGPPGTQKTFVLEHLICELNRKKKPLALYVYASQDMVATALLKRIGQQAGVRIGHVNRERILRNVLDGLVARSGEMPAIVVDEAQHLDVTCLEILRELHDRSGCGLVLAGSHNLYQGFTRPERRPHLEQWLSRIDHRDQLPGLQEHEVREIAARELGNGQPAKLSDKFCKTLVENCRVEDIFSSGQGQDARRYLSVRRLVKLLAQFKAKKEAAA